MPLSTRTRAGGQDESFTHSFPGSLLSLHLLPIHAHWAEQDWGVKQMGDLSTSSRTLSLLHSLSQEQGLSDRHTQELALGLSWDVCLLWKVGAHGHDSLDKEKACQFQAPGEKHGHPQTLTSLQRGPVSAVPRGSPYLPR